MSRVNLRRALRPRLRARRLAILGALTASWGGGCALLIDVDELQSGRGNSAAGGDALGSSGMNATGGDALALGGTGGDAGLDAGVGTGAQTSEAGGNSATDAGTGGSPGLMCPNGCATTTDGCLQSGCLEDGTCTTPCNEQGECPARAKPGFAQQGEDWTIAGGETGGASEVYATTLVAGADRFYAGVYGLFGDGRNVELWSLDDLSATAVPVQGPLLAERLGTGEQAASPVALVPTPEDTVHAVFAAGPDAAAARVGIVSFNQQLEALPQAVVRTSTLPYRAVSDRVGPVAALTTPTDAAGPRELFAAWATQQGNEPLGIALYRPEATPIVEEVVAATDQPVALAAVSSGSSPVVVYALAGASETQPVLKIATFGTQAGLTSLGQVFECPQSMGFEPFVLGAQPTPVSQTWTLTFSAQSAGPAFQSQLLSLVCVNPAGTAVPCEVPQRSCVANGNSAGGVFADISDLTARAFLHPDDDLVFLSAVLASNPSVAALQLVQSARGATSPSPPTNLGPLVCLGPADACAGNPQDTPRLFSHQLAVLGKRLAVSWVEDNPNGNDTVHLRRYEICYP